MRYSTLFLILIFRLAFGGLTTSGYSQSDYDQTLAAISTHRKALLKDQVSTDSCRRYLLDQFEHHVFPHWIGTRWDYNGYTNTPGSDKVIACGYFVSTTLKHMGFNWNRYELAKMYSLRIVENTCADMKRFTDKAELISAVRKKPNNLYIVGLDSHVGFILKRGRSVWFVHANYIGAVGPEKEIAQTSEALDASQAYYVGTFLTEENIKKWLNGTRYTWK